MMPAWERHDFATYAAGLAGVRRRHRAWIVLLWSTIGSIALPLIFGLAGVPREALALAPIVTALLMIGAFTLRQLA